MKKLTGTVAIIASGLAMGGVVGTLMFGAVPIGIRRLFLGKGAAGFHWLPLGMLAYEAVIMLGTFVQLGTSWKQKVSCWVDILCMVLILVIAPAAGIVMNQWQRSYVIAKEGVEQLALFAESWLDFGAVGLLFSLAALVMLMIVSIRRLIYKSREGKILVRFYIPEDL